MFYGIYLLACIFLVMRPLDFKSIFLIGLLVYSYPLLLGFTVYPTIDGLVSYEFSEYIYDFYAILILIALIAFYSMEKIISSSFYRTIVKPITNGKIFLLFLALASALALVASYISGEFTGVFKDKVDVLDNASRILVYYEIITMTLLGASIIFFVRRRTRVVTIFEAALMILAISFSMTIILNGFRTPLLVAIVAFMFSYRYKKFYFNFKVFGFTIVGILLVLFVKDFVSSIAEDRSISFENLLLNLTSNEFSILAVIGDKILINNFQIGLLRGLDYLGAISSIILPGIFDANSTSVYYQALFPEIHYGTTSGTFLDFYLFGGWFGFILLSTLYLVFVGVIDLFIARALSFGSFFSVIVLFFIFFTLLNGLRSDFIMTVTIFKRFLYVIFISKIVSDLLISVLRNRITFSK